MASRSFDDLTPSMKEKTLLFVAKCEEAGLSILIYCTLRSNAEQDALYAVGRTIKGENPKPSKPMGDTVTSARAGQSSHNPDETGKARAFDCVPLLHGKAQWGDKVTYRKMGAIGKACGLKWAGDWQGDFKETAHFSEDGK